MSWWDRVTEDDARLVLGELEAMSEGSDSMASIKELSEGTGVPEHRVAEILRTHPDLAGELDIFDEHGRPYYDFRGSPATLRGRWSRFLRYFTNAGS